MAVSNDSSNRPAYAIVMNSTLPYNLHFCRRLVREIPQAELHVIFTSDDGKWDDRPPPEANPFFVTSHARRNFGAWSKFRLSDWQDARKVLDHLSAHRVTFVVQNGYASLLHIRLLSEYQRYGIQAIIRGDANIKSDIDVAWGRSLCKRSLLWWVLKNSAGVMPMGEYGRQFFVKYGADVSNSILVPYEPDYELFEKVRPDDVAEFRARHGLSSDRNYLLCCSRLVEVKRVDLTIDAFVKLAYDRPEWDLIIVGDGPLRKQLEQRVPPQLTHRVFFLGFLQPSQTRTVFHACHVFVLASDFEPWGVVVNEAAVCGLVTVASDVVGAAHELIEDRENGRIFPSGNLTALVEAMADVTNPGKHELYQPHVRPRLQYWRKIADPVEGVRQALRRNGILPGPTGENPINSSTQTVQIRT